MGKLIEILEPNFKFDDERGSLVQLVREGYKQFNVVTTKAGVFRGGHYHKLNHEVFYVVTGSFKLTAQKDGEKEEYVFNAGDMFDVLPYVLHSFEYTEDTVLVAMYDKGVELSEGQIDSYKGRE